jgi:hypothetical protein
MPAKSRQAEQVRDALHLVTRIADAFDALRGEDVTERESQKYQAEREDALADVLDNSEEAQALLATVLTHRAKSKELHKKIAEGNADASAEAAVILRGLAAHSQAESVRSLMESPDLGHIFNVSESLDDDETMPSEWDDDDGGGDE